VSRRGRFLTIFPPPIFNLKYSAMENNGLYLLAPKFRSDLVRDQKHVPPCDRKHELESLLCMSKEELKEFLKCDKSKDVLKKKT